MYSEGFSLNVFSKYNFYRTISAGPCILTSYFLKCFDSYWSTKNNFKKNFEMKLRAFWIWFITNHFQCNISSLGTFDLYVILTQFISRINQALTPLSFDSALTFIVDKQPLWPPIFCSIWKKNSWHKKLTVCRKVCIHFFTRKLIFM